MIFEQIATGGCQSYLIGCAETCVGALIDPEIRQLDRYLGERGSRRPAHPLRDRHPHACRSFLRRAPFRQGARRAGRHAPGEPGAVRGSEAARRRHAGDRQPSAAGDAHARSHARLDVPARRGSDLHGRHAADRRDGPHGLADRRPRGALRQSLQPAAQARSGAQGVPGARLQATRLEHDRRASSPRTRGCRSATGPSSSR